MTETTVSKQASRTSTVTRDLQVQEQITQNIDEATVKSFGEEWNTFYEFDEEEIQRIGDSYFDIVTPAMLSPEMRAADFGCGTGRWSKYIHEKVAVVAAIDPSDAINAARELLKDVPNVHLFKTSIDKLPFPDGYFDFAFSLGVLHHIPDTQKALNNCVAKLRKGGYFLLYLYYDLENRGFLFKSLFFLSNLLRRMISRFPSWLKKFSCNMMAVFLYMPFVLLSRGLRFLGVSQRIRSRIPLNIYEKASFYIIRNDALDRFGTPLEKRFSKEEIRQMMLTSGLTDIVFSEKAPYWHAVGRKG